MGTINLQKVKKILAVAHGDPKALDVPDRWLYTIGGVWLEIIVRFIR